MAARRPAVVVFDVIETLFSLEPVRARMVDAGLPPHALETWFHRTLRDGFALAAAGGHRPFADVASSTLAAMLAATGADPAEETVSHVLGGFSELEPHGDVVPALDRLGDAGARLMTLTNGNADTTRSLLERAGVAERFEHVLSVDDAGGWKPAARPYRFAAEVAGVAPGDAALVAVHGWACTAPPEPASSRAGRHGWSTASTRCSIRPTCAGPTWWRWSTASSPSLPADLPGGRWRPCRS